MKSVLNDNQKDINALLQYPQLLLHLVRTGSESFHVASSTEDGGEADKGVLLSLFIEISSELCLYSLKVVSLWIDWKICFSGFTD